MHDPCMKSSVGRRGREGACGRQLGLDDLSLSFCSLMSAHRNAPGSDSPHPHVRSLSSLRSNPPLQYSAIHTYSDFVRQPTASHTSVNLISQRRSEQSRLRSASSWSHYCFTSSRVAHVPKQRDNLAFESTYTTLIAVIPF